MRGGDALFEAIEEGISSSVVILALLSPEYVRSENCRREFQLATERRKLIVPVLVSDLEVWPPRGALGPLLTGKLYVTLVGREYGNNISGLLEAIEQSI
mmetsp:Transcript_46768/g.101575  ORF Transcript_46768/g.101575 Transcript_46768/m.101575 type:complete len:99 (+) Transcript_46768:644-940(+)